MKWRWPVVLVLLVAPRAAYPDDEARSHRLHALFANLPTFRPPADDLKFFSYPALRNASPMASSFVNDFKTTLQKAEAARPPVDAAAFACARAMVNVLRAQANWVPMSAQAAQAKYAIQHWAFLQKRWELQERESEFRQAAREYYTVLFAHGFPAMDAGQQREVLDYFKQRIDKLVDLRRQTFELIEQKRLRFWRDVRTGFFKDIRDPLTQAKRAKVHVGGMALERDYEWLLPETATAIAIYSRLLGARESWVRNSQLHPALVAGDAERTRSIRTDILRLRARRAALDVYRSEMQIEGALRSQVNLYLGAKKSLEDAGKRLGNIPGLADGRGLPTQLTQQGLTLLTAGFKFAGDTFSAAVMTPAMDTFTSAILKPAYGLVGEEVKTSVEDARDNYKKQSQALRRRSGLLEKLAESFTYAQARQFVEFMSKDHTGQARAQVSLPLNLRLTTSELLLDAAFIAATQGGLPRIVDIVCETPAEFAAVSYRGAQYALRANLDAAARRIATSRAVKVDAAQPVDEQTLKKIYFPTDESGQPKLLSDREQLLYGIPFVSSVAAVWNFRQNLARTFAFARGNVLDQDAKLKQLQDLQGKAKIVLLALSNVDFDPVPLQRANWTAYEYRTMLLKETHEFAEAAMRIAEARGERQRIALWRAHGGERLTPEGKAKIAALQQNQNRELTTLAVHAGFQRLQAMAHTIDYLGAAEQTRALADLERRRRLAAGIEPAFVDLTAVEKGFRTEAHLEEVYTIFQELVVTIAKEAVITAVSAGLGKLMAKTPPLTKAGAAAPAAKAGWPWKAAGAKLWKSLNPWAGKFERAGMYPLLVSVGGGAIKDSFAQVLAKKQNMFTRAELKDAIELVFDVTEDATTQMLDGMIESAQKWYADRQERKAREKQATESQAWIDDFVHNRLRRVARKLKETDDERERKRLEEELSQLRNDPEFLMQRARLHAAKGNLGAARDRMRRAYEEAEGAAEMLAANMMEAETLDRLRTEGPEKLEDNTLAVAAAEYRSRLASEDVSYRDLQRIIDNADPLQLNGKLFGPGGLGVDAVRGALKRAAANDPDRAMDIFVLGRAIDKVRNQKLADVWTEFSRESGAGGAIDRVVRDGPDASHPEYGGLDANLGLRLYLKTGADRKKVQSDFDEFLKRKGYDDIVRNVEVVPRHRHRGDGETETRTPPKPRDWPPGRPLPRRTDVELQRLDAAELERIEKTQGFQTDHCDNMHRFAQEHQAFLIVRDGNPGSVKYFNNPRYTPKALSCKAKTMKVGEYAGLVVDPTNAKIAEMWKKEIAEASGARKAKLEADWQKAKDTWADYGAQIVSSGEYRVDTKTGLIEQKIVDEQGTTWKKIHGDYDLHGVYKQEPDGTVLRVDYGSGEDESNRISEGLRKQLSRATAGVFKEWFQHGAQDNWGYEGKKSDPPATVFFPDGRPPLRLETAEDMKRFYEHEMRVKWDYRDGHKDAGYRPPPAPATPREFQAGGEVFLSRAAAAWVTNREEATGAYLDGATAGTTPIRREDAPALALDMARGLGFLTDPQYETMDAAKAESLLRETEKFLRLVDAYAIGHSESSYAARLGNAATGYYGAMVDEVSRYRDSVFAGGDLETLGALVAWQKNDPNAPRPQGEELTQRASETLRWMRGKTADLLAATGAAVRDADARLRSSATPGEKADARELMASVARIGLRSHTLENYGTTALTRLPVDVSGETPRPLDPNGHRAAIARGMQRTLQQRLQIARIQDEERRRMEEEYEGKEIDDAARQAMRERIEAALQQEVMPDVAADAGEAMRWIDYARAFSAD